MHDIHFPHRADARGEPETIQLSFLLGAIVI